MERGTSSASLARSDDATTGEETPSRADLGLRELWHRQTLLVVSQPANVSEEPRLHIAPREVPR
eukprot:992555-Lingulodinium_polyedra.AAC.1